MPQERKIVWFRLPSDNSDAMESAKATIIHPAKTVKGEGSARLFGK